VEPRLNESFGKYTLVRRIAMGGMAEIFLAEHHGEAGFVHPVVIKRVLPGLSDNPEFESMFLDEARLLARLSHPNVVHVYDFGRIDAIYFLALEYVRGGNLRDLVARLNGGPLPIPDALYVAAQALAGLDHAHRSRAPDGSPLRLVHRDISPSNILLSTEGAVKLADFGIARSRIQQVHTAAYVIKGKLSYMSPEQVSGRPLDARSDLFSMGTLLWEMVTGRRLFARDNPGAIQMAIYLEPVPDARDYRPDIPAPLIKLLDRALQRDREHRFPSAQKMQAAVEECVLECRLIASAHRLGALVRGCFPELAEETHDEAADADGRGTRPESPGTVVIDDDAAAALSTDATRDSRGASNPARTASSGSQQRSPAACRPDAVYAAEVADELLSRSASQIPLALARTLQADAQPLISAARTPLPLAPIGSAHTPRPQSSSRTPWPVTRDGSPSEAGSREAITARQVRPGDLGAVFVSSLHGAVRWAVHALVYANRRLLSGVGRAILSTPRAFAAVIRVLKEPRRVAPDGHRHRLLRPLPVAGLAGLLLLGATVLYLLLRSEPPPAPEATPNLADFLTPLPTNGSRPTAPPLPKGTPERSGIVSPDVAVHARDGGGPAENARGSTLPPPRKPLDDL
jgi:serine/threonine protein kinase